MLNLYVVSPKIKELYILVLLGNKTHHRIKDIDVKVYKWVNEQWVLIEKDEDTSSVAVVTVSPSSTADYKIVISAYSFEDGYEAGHYGLLVFHE